MRLLVTRPEPDATRTARALRARGHDPVIAPVAHIERLPCPTLASGGDQAVVLTSRHAVFALAEVRPPRPVATVGAKTAAAVAATGLPAPIIVAQDSGELAARIIAQLHPQDGALRYLCAVERRDAWVSLVERTGFVVISVEVYKTCAVDRLPVALLDMLRHASLDGVLHFSPRSADRLHKLLAAAGMVDTLSSLAAFCLSAAVATRCRGRYRRVHVAAAPTHAALLDLVDAPGRDG